VDSVADKVAMGQVSSEYFSYPLPIIIPLLPCTHIINLIVWNLYKSTKGIDLTPP